MILVNKISINLYLQTATDQQIEEAMDEYGNAIKQIAAANIFPGDMLLKNFVVFTVGRLSLFRPLVGITWDCLL